MMVFCAVEAGMVVALTALQHGRLLRNHKVPPIAYIITRLVNKKINSQTIKKHGHRPPQERKRQRQPESTRLLGQKACSRSMPCALRRVVEGLHYRSS